MARPSAATGPREYRSGEGRSSRALTTLLAALKELQQSPHNVGAVGDAENDHAFLRFCGCAAAVSNALLMLNEMRPQRFVRQLVGGAAGLPKRAASVLHSGISSNFAALW